MTDRFNIITIPESFLSVRWENIKMANYEVDAAVFKPLVPKAVELEDYKCSLWLVAQGLYLKNKSISNPLDRNDLDHWVFPEVGT